MRSNLLWKFALVALLVVLCFLSIYPPSQKLKPGIDLGGGTSLIYQIDTTGLEGSALRDVAQKMIRIQQRRIDPGSKRNLVWRPHGNDRIEIQMPLATDETRQLRGAYKEALAKLAAYNINLRQVRQEMVKPAGMSQADYVSRRDEQLKKLAGGDQRRLDLFTAWATASDALTAAEQKRDEMLAVQEDLVSKLKEAKVSDVLAERLYNRWGELDDPNKTKEMGELTKGDENADQLLRKYMEMRQQLSKVRHEIHPAEEADGTGLIGLEKQARKNIDQANINLDLFEKFLDVKKDKRAEEVATLKASHPQAAELLDAVVVAYDAYSKLAGRLDDPEDLKRQLRGSGVLEFRILPGSGDLSEADIKNYHDQLTQSGPQKAGDDKYVWCGIKDPEEFRAGAVTGEFAEKKYVLAANSPEDSLKHKTGEGAWKLKTAYVTTDQYGSWAVGFGFNEAGANLFLDLTKSNLGKPLCILLDGEAISAPNIQAAIRDRGIITGRFSQQEVQDLADKLNAGSLPARLSNQPISENTIGATMGRDNLEAGLNAGKYSLIAVVLFMLLYYMIAGALADVALVLNIALIVGIMAFSRATFTMPGIAGLILTIGMAVDANVLVYERIREEQQRGASLRIAIKNGYDRAFRTIFDANLTTFLVALILWIFASEEIKGFALTLMIGLVCNMFTALFVTRMIFDFLTDIKVLKNKLTMMQLISNDMKIKWMSFRPLFWLGSLILVAGSWMVYIGRDEATNSKYSIEFTGGTDIHVALTEEGAAAMLSKEEQAAGVTLREKVEQAVRQEGKRIGNPLLAESRVQQVGPIEKHVYSIVTTETNRLEAKLSVTGESKPSATEIENMIRQAGQALGDRRLGETTVTASQSAGEYMLMTRQTDINKVTQVVKQAIPQAQLDNPVVNAVVGDAVRYALDGKLDLTANLQPGDIKSEPITDELIGRKPYLSSYAGGIFLSCQLGEGKSETMERLAKRFDDSRFRSEFEKYVYNEPHLFAPGGVIVGPEERLTGIEVAVMSGDIVYGGSSEEEWRDLEANEQGRLKDTLSMETSFVRLTQIDPSVGQESMMAAIIAIVFSLLAIMGYIWLRFGNVRFSTAAVLSLVHDVSIALGMIAASAWLSTIHLGRAWASWI